MKDGDILIKGLTPSKEVLKNLRNIPHSSLVHNNTLKLSYIPYEISKILSINVGISIKTFKKTKLKKGCKVNIIGFRNIDIDYVAEESKDKVHQLNYKIPFSTEIYYGYDRGDVKGVYVPVDKLYYKIVNPKEVMVITRAYIAPLCG
ncbi:hypothetical protein GCM10008905_23580 [Clostridium malenominatum]|uniref:SipL SPOCS domain-containing protein n=1 Tax=Clostridium malenominatum TaxID=1539 RepID=A0ABN1J386_9CLOT